MPLPHGFKPGEDPQSFIQYGTYYRLVPVQGAVGSHVITKPMLLPVTDSVSWSFQHRWNESDNLAKSIIDSAVQKGSSLVGATVANTTSRFLQRKIGGAPHVSACAIYVDSEPPTLSVKTKMFSPDGAGSILQIIELFRQDTHGATGSKAAKTVGAKAGQLAGGGAVASGIQNLQGNATGLADKFNAAGNGSKVLGGAGWIAHPEWWKIQVVTFSQSGQTILATMDNMHCTNMNVTMYAPFYNNEPSMIELELGFMHGFRGTRESMRFSG